MTANPYRQILWATSLIGGSSLAVVLLGVMRMKAFAVLLGPAGVGLAGLYTNLMMTAAAILGLGIATSAVREIAAAGDGPERLKTRLSVRVLAVILAVAAAAIVVLLRKPVAIYVLQLPDRYADIGWIGIGVAATILSTAGVATLQGMRRVRQYSLAGIIGTLIGSAVSVGIVWWQGVSGVFLSVSCIPLFLAMTAWLFVDRSDLGIVTNAREVWVRSKPILRLGATLMVAGALQTTTMLIVRALVTQKYGLGAAGFFHAATLISAAYVSFILQSLAGDFYPRLTSVIDDRVQAGELVNHQAQVVMVLALPFILVTIGFSHLIVQLFYSESFAPAAEILKWQVFGDVFKIMALPVATVMLSKGSSGLYFLAEFVWNLLYVVLTALAIERLGLTAVGSAFAFAFVVYFVIVFSVGRRKIKFQPTKRTIVIWGVAIASGSVTLAASFLPHSFAYAITVLTTLGSLLLLLRVVGPGLFAGADESAVLRALQGVAKRLKLS